jgi:hypothetical protein
MQFDVGGIDHRRSFVDAAVESKVLCAKQAAQNPRLLSAVAHETDLHAG